MKEKFLRFTKNEIKKYKNDYSDEKIDEIMYGIEGLYITISKSFIIFLIAFFLGILKELVLLLFFYNIIRLFSFGIHASKSYICLIFSSLIFIIGAFLCKYVTLNNYIIYGLYFMFLIIILLYSPADTEKRPIIRGDKRKKFKILSLLVLLIYFIITTLIDNNLITNCLTIGLLIECILILPITYKIFKMQYKNYQNYGLNVE